MILGLVWLAVPEPEPGFGSGFGLGSFILDLPQGVSLWGAFAWKLAASGSYVCLDLLIELYVREVCDLGEFLGILL